jgi:DNA-directed RNA polymerase specialized sigma24 family protein
MRLETIDAASDRGFEQSMLKTLPALRRFAAACVDIADREDLVQDTLARAWLKRAAFDPQRGGLQGWLLAIMADQARQRWRRRPTPWLRPETITQTDHHPSEFSDVTIAVNRLPRRQREVVVLFITSICPSRRLLRSCIALKALSNPRCTTRESA